MNSEVVNYCIIHKVKIHFIPKIMLNMKKYYGPSITQRNTLESNSQKNECYKSKQTNALKAELLTINCSTVRGKVAEYKRICRSVGKKLITLSKMPLKS